MTGNPDRGHDEVGLLLPASVDPASGYRRYRREQAGRARQIATLRWDGLPIEEIRRQAPRPARQPVMPKRFAALSRMMSRICSSLRPSSLSAKSIGSATPSGCG